MGICHSASDTLQLKPLYTRDDINDFKLLELSPPDIEYFNTTFQRLDLSNKKVLNIEDYLWDLKIPRNMITNHIFNFIAGGEDSEISFREFVLYNWHFLSMSERDIAGFSFDLYDVEKKGKVPVTELEVALCIVHDGKDTSDYKFKKKLNALMELMDDDLDEHVTREEYQDHIRIVPVLLFPVFEIQVHL